MNEMLLFAILGVSVVAIFVLLLWGSGPENRKEVPQSDGADFENPSLPAELLIERIFGAEDWNFFRDRVPHDARKQFLKDRQELAFFWLALIRERVRLIMHAHLTQARRLQGLKPSIELRVAANYFGFQITCSLVACLLWLQGPVATGRMVRRADVLCGKLRAMTALPLESASRSIVLKG